MAVTKGTLSPVVQSVLSTPQGKLYPVFNGTTHYATIPAWSSVSDPALTRIVVDTSNDDGFLCGSTQPITELGRVGANYHNGQPRAVKIIDPSPLQGARFMPGNGTNRYIAIPEITLSGDFEIELWDERVDSGAGDEQSFFGHSTLTDRIEMRDTSAGTVPNRFAYSASGMFNTIADAYLGIAQNQHFHQKLVKTGTTITLFIDGVSKGSFSNSGTLILDRIGDSSAGGVQRHFQSPMGLIKIRDLTNNNTWEYNNRDDTGNVVRNTGNTGAAFNGIVYEGASPMTPSAADAARNFLPMISDEYIFDEAGRIKSVRRGPAFDATLQGGLSATDWAPE